MHPPEWDEIKDSFSKAVARSSAEFSSLAARYPVLGAFRSAADLVAHLRQNQSSPDELDLKDSELAALVESARTGHNRQLAMGLLWLGLGPGLNGVLRRLLAKPTQKDDAVSSIAESFVHVVGRLRIAGVNRVAATLIRNTERVARSSMRGERQWRSVAVDLEDVGDRAGTSPPPADLFALCAAVARSDVADSCLVLELLVADRTREEIAAARGIPEAAVRKRLQRAIGRLQAELVGGCKRKSKFDIVLVPFFRAGARLEKEGQEPQGGFR